MIDPASLKKYRQTKGRLGSRLHNEIDWEEGAFRQYEKRCAFLNEENLCDLYIEGMRKELFANMRIAVPFSMNKNCVICT